MKRSMTDFKSNWVTTLTGVVLAVTVLLASIGVLSPEQSGEIQGQSVIIFDAVSKIIGAVSAIILMFQAKDA